MINNKSKKVVNNKRPTLRQLKSGKILNFMKT